MAIQRIDQSIAKVDRWSGVINTELLRMSFDVVDSNFVSMMRYKPAGVMRLPLASFEPKLREWFERSDALRDWTCTHLEAEVRAADPTWSDVAQLAEGRCLVAD